MAKTLREKYIKALEAMGETQIKGLSRFIVFTRAAGGHYYIGRSGSLRIGQTVTTSIPASKVFKDKLLAPPAPVNTSC